MIVKVDEIRINAWILYAQSFDVHWPKIPEIKIVESMTRSVINIHITMILTVSFASNIASEFFEFIAESSAATSIGLRKYSTPW